MPVVGLSAGVPAGGKIEVEFAAGVWTDVTEDVDATSAFTIRVGRTSEFTAPSTGQLDGLRLDNHTGKYTPLSQVLVDGTAHPYWPNVLPRKRIRYSNTPAGVRVVAYIKGWPPFVDQDGRAAVMISATDRLDQLARVTLKSPILQEFSQDVPIGSWPLTDEVGSVVAAGDPASAAMTLDVRATGNVGTFGGVGPGFGDGTGWNVTPGVCLSTMLPAMSDAGAYTYELWANFTAWPSNFVELLWIGQNFSYISVSSSGECSGPAGFGSFAQLSLGLWNHLAVTVAADLSTILYVNGVAVVTTGPATTNPADPFIAIGDYYNYATTALDVNLGYVAVYASELPAARVAAHHAAGMGYPGDTTDARVARWLGAAGLTSADWDLDVGVAVVGTYPQDGKDVVAACQDMAVTEGQGSVLYVTGDGIARFTNRATRTPGAAPVMFLDAEADLDGAVYAPSFDELTLVNQCTGNRAAVSGTLSSQVFTDPVSVALYGLSTDSSGVTSYSLSDLDVLCLAQSRVAGNANPGFRLPQVGVDLVTATNSLYAALGGVVIGSRIRVTNLPVAQGPATQLDLIVEGWTETISTGTYMVVFDTSPADSPALGVYDDTSYGRYQCSGQTLNAAITSSATTLVIATAGPAPTFTTVAGRYPMNIQIGQEIITLTVVPGGAGSPQTFTGCTRAVAGTQAAAQAAGSTVNLFPAATYAL